jgi:hypothetical protein
MNHKTVMMGLGISPSDWDSHQFTPNSKAVLVTSVTHLEKTNAVTQFFGRYNATVQPTDQNLVRLWDVETAQEIGTFTNCQHALHSPDGKTLATAHYDGTMACELSNWKDANIIGALAGCCAECGDFMEAVKWETKALEIGYKTKRETEAAMKRLKLYEEGKPFRE